MIENIKELIFRRNKETEQNLLSIFQSNYTQNQDFVRNMIYYIVRNDDVDDLVQDTFVKAWKNFKKFNNKSSFKTWIYTIAKNTAYDYLKKKKKTLISTADETPSLSKRQVYKDSITRALEKLPQKQKTVFILFYKMEYSLKEISELLQISEGTVKSRLFYAKKTFIREFEKEDKNHG